MRFTHRFANFFVSRKGRSPGVSLFQYLPGGGNKLPKITSRTTIDNAINVREVEYPAGCVSPIRHL